MENTFADLKYLRDHVTLIYNLLAICLQSTTGKVKTY